MIFRSIVILCALSACAATTETRPKSTPTPQPVETPSPAPASPELDLKRAHSLLKLGQTKKALKVLQKWENEKEAPAVLLHTLGRLRAASNQLVPAIKLYERALAKEPKRRWRIELAAIYDFSGRSNDAIELYIALLAEQEDNALRRELGLTLLLAKEPARAIPHLKKSLSVKPNLDNRAELALALCYAEKFSEADQTLRDGTQSSADGLYTPAAIGEVIQCLGDPVATLDLVKSIQSRLDAGLYQRLLEALSRQAHTN